MKGIRSLLFVCESAAIENAVMEQAKATYFPVNEVALGFARLEQWRHDAGGMEIRVGRECMTWARFSTLRISCAGRRAQAA
jgi:hypothetical protein